MALIFYKSAHGHGLSKTIIYWSFFWETATVPSLNPFLKRLRTSERCLILPVPVVFLLRALTDQPNFLVRAPG